MDSANQSEAVEISGSCSRIRETIASDFSKKIEAGRAGDAGLFVVIVSGNQVCKEKLRSVQWDD